MQLAELETPALIADRSRIAVNAQRMREHAAAHDIALRPHLKTTKSAAIARIAHGGEVGPGAVSTLREADYFLERGIADLTYAVCVTPNKFAHVADLVRRGADLKVLLASARIARQLAEFASGADVRIKAMIEIDCGDHRTGLAADAQELLVAAVMLNESVGVEFSGLLTHGGQSYACRSEAAIRQVADEEREALLSASARLKEAGVACQTLSSGSTPTAALGSNFSGLTELRPGVYLAGDLFQAQLGSCAFDDIAVSVLASVIAHDPTRNRLVLDAGGLALSKDRSTAEAPVDYGYGLVVRESGASFNKPVEHDMIVVGVSQEHGEVTSKSSLPFDELPIGSRVRVLPNHVCMTAAAYDRYYVVDSGGTDVIDEWDKASGW